MIVLTVSVNLYRQSGVSLGWIACEDGFEPIREGLSDCLGAFRFSLAEVVFLGRILGEIVEFGAILFVEIEELVVALADGRLGCGSFVTVGRVVVGEVPDEGVAIDRLSA